MIEDNLEFTQGDKLRRNSEYNWPDEDENFYVMRRFWDVDKDELVYRIWYYDKDLDKIHPAEYAHEAFERVFPLMGDSGDTA